MNNSKPCLALFAATLLLASCGGGGGAATEPLATATVVFEPLPIKLNFVAGGLTAESDMNLVNVKASVSGAAAAPFVYLDADAAVASNTSVALTQSSANVFTGVIKFRTDLAANTYSGAFKLRLCVDPNCEQTYSSNVTSVPYQITVDAGANIYLLDEQGTRILIQNYQLTTSGTQLTLESNTPVVWSVTNVSSGSTVTVISQSLSEWSGRLDVPRAVGEAPPGSFNLVATPVAAGIASKSIQLIASAPYF